MRVHFSTIIIFLIALTSWSNALALITVGPVGSTCDITTGTTKIQDAINSGDSTIHIVNDGTYTENIIIDNKSISLVGGFASCADAVSGMRNATDMSVIVGSVGSMRPVIIISGTASLNSVELTGLDISAGESGLGLGGGGIGMLSANVLLTIRNLNIHDNNSNTGGGINMIVGNSNANLFIFDTIISQNQGNQGGGLYCNKIGSALNPLINIQGLSGISENSVTGDGGGVFLGNGCDLTFFSGDSDITSNLGINRNTAAGKGGGIYAENGSKATLNGHEVCDLLGCTGNDNQPITVASNTAQGNGGGIFLTGFGTQMDMNMVLLADNTSNFHGGGIAIENNALINVTRPKKECWNESHCNFLTGNKSGEITGLGGLIYNTGAIANINQTEIAFNRADIGTVLYSLGGGSSTTFIGCIIRDNGGIHIGSFPYDDKYIFRVVNLARVDIYHSTIADNLADVAVFGIASNAGVVSEIHNSIVSDASTGTLIEPFIGSQSLVDFQKCILHEKDSLELPPLPNRVDLQVNDPLFVNRVANNFHIDPINSPAIDFAASDHSFLKDMDYEDRGTDFPAINDFFGPYDVGADEAQRPDAMFSDGFEN